MNGDLASPHKKIALVTDAWLPQVNGVTTTLSRCVLELEHMGHNVLVISPQLFRTTPCPRYREIRLALFPGRKVKRLLSASDPHAVHIATEGPLGLAARRFCTRRKVPFTTSFHTRFAEYLSVYAGVSVNLGYRMLRWFHRPAARTLVPTPSMERDLAERGFDDLVCWRRGVDNDLFKPDYAPVYDLPRPIFLYAGRVAPEKNIEAFLALDLPGSKVVVGNGPAMAELRSRYPKIYWAGYRFGEDLAQHYCDADVFVFPSRTDTYGIVMLEANASGLPVAAFPVTGPVDVVREGHNGALDENLQSACMRALDVDRSSCREFALEHTWSRCAEVLRDNLAFSAA